MPSQNRLALEHMLEYEEEPSEEFRSSVAALPVDLVSDPNQFPIFTNADRALPVELVSDPNQLPIYKCISCNHCDSYNNANKHKKREIILS